MQETKRYEKPKVQTYRDLIVYQKSFTLAMDAFRFTTGFPKEERYGLTDQLRRAARSIPANIAEGWAKRKFENIFKRHLLDAIGSCEEVKVWLEMAKECQYVTEEVYEKHINHCNEIGAMLQSLMEKWQSF